MTPALSIYLMAARRAEPFARRRLRRVDGEVDEELPDYLGEPSEPRPAGELVWIHLGAAQPREAATALAARFRVERPGAQVLLTCDDPMVRGGGKWRARPADWPGCAESFLDNWRPDAAVWIGAPIWPALAAATSERRIPFVLANADEALTASFRGVPSRDLLDLFTLIFATSTRAAQALQRLAWVPVHTLGSLQRAAPPPGCDDADRAEVSSALDARPVWLAAGVPEAELREVRRAQRIAQRSAHRLLLVLIPDAPETAELLADVPTLARRSVTPLPPPTVSTFIADLPHEEGLWFRLAPITYIGGTLGGRGATIDPFAPAALGSAVLHGPATSPFEAHFAALTAAAATWPIAHATALGPAIGDLQAADRVAALAHRSWAVVTEGAEATDALVERLGRAIDA